MRDIFKLGFVGGGLNSVAGYSHFVASQMDSRFKVASGVFSRDNKINRDTGEYWGVEKVYSDINEMIVAEKNDLDAVAVLLPTPNHLEVIDSLLKNNIPVICEKPLVSSMSEIEYLAKYDFNKNFLVTTYNYTGFPIIREMKDMIKNGDLGEILTIHLEMPQESFLRPPKSVDYPPEWRKYDKEIPTIMLDLMSHLYSLSYFLTGKDIVNVQSTMKKYSKYNVIDDVKVFTEYEDNSSGFMWVSKVALGNRNGLAVKIHGSKASMKWVQEQPEKLFINYSTGQKCVLDRGSNLSISKNRIYNRMTAGHPAGFVEAFANCYYNIGDSLADFKNGKNYNLNPFIWNFENEKKNVEFLHRVVEGYI